MPNAAHSPHVTRQFVLFAIIGTAGFVVDSAVLLAAIKLGHYGPYLSRLFSYLAAATFTWAANRRFTFPAAQRSGRAAQWARFVATNAVGGAANLGTYAWLIAHVPTVAHWPVLGVAAGSLAGLLINFSLSRSLVFRH